MNPGTLLIRADANAAIGSGHVMRCLALAQSWRQAGGNVVFGMAEATAAVEQRLVENSCRIAQVAGSPGSGEDLRGTRVLVAAESPSWIVLDGYQFDAHYQSELKRLRPLLVVDDNGLVEHYSADVVANQNVHATEAMYMRRGQHTRLLLGPQYALLRNEFAAYRQWTREIPARGTRLLVTMGGSDPSGFTPRILRQLAELPGNALQIRVVVGGSATNASVVKEVAAEHGGRVQVILDARNMAELMEWADLAVAAAGSTCWEMCLLGLPAILVVAAENQRPIARQLDVVGAGLNAGPSAEIDSAWLAQRAHQLLMSADARIAMSRAARKLVDGRGRERVLDVMQTGDAPCA
ncbi:MAG: UDP-2,4-diacetamido-2,4,6-trideoxy-beta-L-altropyranose hydrolase [Terriglobales bacterium]